MKNVYVVGGDKAVIDMFEKNGWITWYSFPEACEEVTGWPPDLICFTGGSDIDPKLYGEEVNGAYGIDSKRDEFEVDVFSKFVHKVPMVGICRGGQLLNVLNGGSMIQHINGHSWEDREVTNHIFEGSHPGPWTLREDHHQGMVPHPMAQVLATDSRDQNSEIIWYEKTSCLCFQAHPEWGHEETEKIFFVLLEEYFN